MPRNINLRLARLARQDEFYTQFDDIVLELQHYEEHFKGKTVLCNCDDPYESNFFKFFALNFMHLGLKKLICTCWYQSQIVGRELSWIDDNRDFFLNSCITTAKKKAAYKIELTNNSELFNHGPINLNDVRAYLELHKPETLTGTGDYKSPECISFLQEADIVVTNPPFSLFREYLATLLKYDKKFLIIGNKNSLALKEVFPLIQNNTLWTGYRGFSGGMWFYANYEGKTQKFVNGKKLINVPTIWYTNLDNIKRHTKIDLYMVYKNNQSSYPKFENFDAINVDKTSEIPKDYDGIMGVPITFLDKYCPEQFEIIGLGIAGLGLQAGVKPYKPEHKNFRKNVQKRGAVDGDLYMIKDGVVTVPYSRILIRRKI